MVTKPITLELDGVMPPAISPLVVFIPLAPGSPTETVKSPKSAAFPVVAIST